jgi:hypothetical protein
MIIRYAFNDDEMPTWFEKEEAPHRVRGIPMTKEMADEIKVLYGQNNEHDSCERVLLVRMF